MLSLEKSGSNRSHFTEILSALAEKEKKEGKSMAKVIFIMTDSQRYDMVNANVPTGLKTPCLDRLASQGMRFSRAYTTQPVCQPARCASVHRLVSPIRATAVPIPPALFR